MGGKRRTTREDESWWMLEPMLSLNLKLHHLGRRAPLAYSVPLSSLHTAGRLPPPVRLLKFQTFPPTGRGRVLLNLKGKSLPLPGFPLVGVGPIPVRVAGGLAVGGVPRRGPGADCRQEPPGGRWGWDSPCRRRLLSELADGRLLRFARGSGAPRSAGAALSGRDMKSLKSRLKRQDAPGPTPSGAVAPASAVSPAARALPGLPVLPSREPRSPPQLCSLSERPAGPVRGRLLPPQAGALRRPGDPETPRHCPRASTGPFPAAHPQVSQLLALGIGLPPPPPAGVSGLSSIRPLSSDAPPPQRRPLLPCWPPLPTPALSPQGSEGRPAPLCPWGCGPGGGWAPRSPGGQGSRPGAAPPDSGPSVGERCPAGWTSCAGCCRGVTRKV